MSKITRREYSPECLIVATAIANKKMDHTIFEAINCLRNFVNYQFHPVFDCKRIKKLSTLCRAFDQHITVAALSRGLFFRETKPLAVISGAGIAGLAASFELRARGFNVVIAEKRREFSRFNIINLNIETQVFLKRFNLLEKFEKFVAARITEHRYVVIDKTKNARRLDVSDVSKLQLDESVSFETKNINKLFTKDGIYSVSIGTLQTFLAENALRAGVNIFGEVTVRVLGRTHTGGVSSVQITVDKILQPHLFFIAEGAHSSTALQLGMRTKKVINACSGENWIFGNMTHSGKETFVISVIDTSEKALRIANVIFNAKSRVINIAVTSDREVDKKSIEAQILQTAHQVFTQTAFPLEKMDSKLVTTVHKPVHVVNRTSNPFSMGNVFCIGDAAGSSSPLAGLGGTLGLTLVPATVKGLLDDYQRQSGDIREKFDEATDAYTKRWIQKSEGIKNLCLSLFDKEVHVNE